MADLREALDTAFDTVADAPDPAPEAAPPAEPVTDEPGSTPSPEADQQAAPRGDRPRGPDGKFVKGEDAPPAAPAPTKAKDPTAPPAQEAKPPATEKPAAPTPPPAAKAPQSWKPDAREDWAKLPPRVQAEVLRREGEVQRALQESSEARQGYQKYSEAVKPYEQMIRAEGGEPVAAIQGLLQTAYALRHAPLPVKADMIAKMVKAYIPGREGLEALDRLLAGEAPAAQPQGQQFRDPRVDQIMTVLEQNKRAAEQATSQRAEQMIAEVQGREFFEDLRLDIADILEGAQRRGLSMTLDEAYHRAARADPTISAVLSQRAEAQRLANPNGSTQAARRASSSVRSNPAIPPRGDRSPGDLRADLEAALDSASGRS